jgi:hypothetical protein
MCPSWLAHGMCRGQNIVSGMSSICRGQNIGFLNQQFLARKRKEKHSFLAWLITQVAG